MSFIPTGFLEVVVTFGQVGTTRPAQITFGGDPGLTFAPTGFSQRLYQRMAATNHILSAVEYDTDLAVLELRTTIMTSTGPVIDAFALNQPGSRTGEAAPPNVAAMLRRSTDRGGRAGRGRLYLPSSYISEADMIAGGFLTSARRSRLNDLAATILVDFNAEDVQHVLLHTSDETMAPDPITSYSAQQLMATQRRRLRK